MISLPKLEELLEAGVHLGHVASRWHPKMQPYIFTTRNKIHVIHLEKTLEQLRKALEFVQEVVSRGGLVMFVGTKRQAKDQVRAAADSCGMPYVTVRWLGGTFTNFKTIQKTIRKMEKIQKSQVAEDFSEKYTKKERLLMEREVQKMEKLFSGIKNLKRLPEAMFVTDVNHDRIAVQEAKNAGVKVIGLVDTNTNPELVDYPIPCNDDAIKAISLMTNLFASAVLAGQQNAATVAAASQAEKPSETPTQE